MKLDDFIFETVSQIVNGINRVNKEYSDSGAKIDSRNLNYTGSKNGGGVVYSDRNDGEIVENIKFDVAITASENEKGKGGIGVYVGAIGIGGQIQDEVGTTEVSRIKFSLPLYLPNKLK